MFLSRKNLSLAVIVLLGLVFGFAWYLTKDPTSRDLELSKEMAFSYLLASFDQDYHFIHRKNFSGSKVPITRTEQFKGELESAITLAQIARTDSNYSDIHKKNLEIILGDWYTESDTLAYLSNGAPSMEQNGLGLKLLSASPMFEEEKNKAEKLASPISSWAQKDLTSYWKGASTTPAESVGYGILGMISLYQRTGYPEHKDTVEALAKRYRLLLDRTPLRLLVQVSLYNTLKQEEDLRSLVISAKSFLNLQNKNLLSGDYGFFHNSEGVYYTIAEQAMMVEGLTRASLIEKSLGQDDIAKSFMNSALLGTGALLRAQISSSKEISGGILREIRGVTVDSYSTARFIQALKALVD